MKSINFALACALVLSAATGSAQAQLADSAGAVSKSISSGVLPQSVDSATIQSVSNRPWTLTAGLANTVRCQEGQPVCYKIDSVGQILYPFYPNGAKWGKTATQVVYAPSIQTGNLDVILSYQYMSGEGTYYCTLARPLGNGSMGSVQDWFVTGRVAWSSEC